MITQINIPNQAPINICREPERAGLLPAGAVGYWQESVRTIRIHPDLEGVDFLGVLACLRGSAREEQGDRGRCGGSRIASRVHPWSRRLARAVAAGERRSVLHRD